MDAGEPRMKTRAAVLVETGKPLVVTEIDLPALKPGQVLVEVSFSGVCHTQLLECRGYRGIDKFLPHCLGHEGSGLVRETGPGVTLVKPEDRVILSWIKGPGMDVPGSQYSWNGRPVNAGGITTFSRHSVLSENRLTLLEEGVPMREAALLGCAVPTGVGSVLNTAETKAGQSIAVFGLGGIGLSAIAGAVLAGASPIIGIDLRPEKFEVASKMGATHTIDPRKGDVAQAIRGICPAGLDVAIEATGTAAAMRQALQCVRSQGGKAVIVGNARHGEMLELDPREFNQGKRLLGTWGGDTVPNRDLPKYARLLREGKLRVDALLSKTFSLDAINAALEALENGQAVRPLIDMSLSDS
jgi:S-(hydroxymethyl)glutathione dehydrogenase/alcohol dehydrogenase